jgi:diguanylate cyclase (GGDEF)-like protein
MVARLGGDEFGILLESLSDDGVADGSFLARRLAKRVCQESYLLEDQHADIGISIGIAIHPTTAADIETLLEQADLAMYEAKRMSGTTWRIAEPRVRLKPDIT